MFFERCMGTMDSICASLWQPTHTPISREFSRGCSPHPQTTLLNHILKADHGKRIAVIENEVCG